MAGAGLTVRPLAAEDRAAWGDLWRGYLAFYRTELPAAQYDLTFARLLDPAEPMAGLIATDGGAAVGLAHMVRHRSSWTAGDYAYLQDLYAAPGARGRGVGRALIEAVYARAEAEGAARVYWLTHETNTEARQLYDRIAERSGFIQYRRL